MKRKVQWIMAVLLLFLPGRSYNYSLGGEQADYVGRCIVIAPDYEGYGVTKDVLLSLQPRNC